jgi:hypothetical protein
VDEVARLIQLFEARADGPAAARLEVLVDIRPHRDPRIVPFLLDVLLDGGESIEVRLHVVKQLRRYPRAADECLAVGRAIARVLVAAGDARLRLQAALALACFSEVNGIPAALGDVALDPIESPDLRFAAFTSLERAGATPECVSLMRRLTSDETLGRAASALLATWGVNPCSDSSQWRRGTQT